MNPLLSEFPETGENGFLMTTFDWEKHGVHLPYVIFITGRCGSTLLSHMIKDTGLAGTPDEYFNEGFITSFCKDLEEKTFSNYFSHVVQKYSSGYRFGFEIDWYRLRHLEKILNVSNMFPAHRTTFFYMTRRDIVGQAWSYALAKATGVWHSFAGQTLADRPPPPELSDEAIWREIHILLEAERQMEAFFLRHQITPLLLDYEQFVADKRGVLASMLVSLGCSMDDVLSKVAEIADKTERMPGRQVGEIIKFKNKYMDFLVDLEPTRGAQFGDLKNRLRDEYGVVI